MSNVRTTKTSPILYGWVLYLNSPLSLLFIKVPIQVHAHCSDDDLNVTAVSSDNYRFCCWNISFWVIFLVTVSFQVWYAIYCKHGKVTSFYEVFIFGNFTRTLMSKIKYLNYPPSSITRDVILCSSYRNIMRFFHLHT